ncbi:MAG: 3'-5' exonuclease [Thiomicrospira sp.]|jgi:hypothetical protein|nr:3'-5' exonuclease [Thiomicrospira sp.]MDY0137807.1 3'-5' exonuclease [Thiomicrospira sp.]
MQYYLFCDTETGGLNPDQPILQIGWQVVASCGSVVKRGDYFFWPDWDKVDEKALAVNGLYPHVLESIITLQNLDGFVDFDNALSRLVADMHDYKAPFVAYNSPYDVSMIRGNAKCRDDFDAALSEFGEIDVMDPARQFLKWDKWLKQTVAYNKITGHAPPDNAHTAHADIDMTREIFFKLQAVNAI